SESDSAAPSRAADRDDRSPRPLETALAPDDGGCSSLAADRPAQSAFPPARHRAAAWQSRLPRPVQSGLLPEPGFAPAGSIPATVVSCEVVGCQSLPEA